ncbi:MAG: hypothetical protein ACK5NT_06515, partial [Pyrinomonadaceae bacterium]
MSNRLTDNRIYLGAILLAIAVIFGYSLVIYRFGKYAGERSAKTAYAQSEKELQKRVDALQAEADSAKENADKSAIENDV